MYVMHTKKAQVPKEEFEAIRQCQQEERDRKLRGLKEPWKKQPTQFVPLSSHIPYNHVVPSDSTSFPPGAQHHQPAPVPAPGSTPGPHFNSPDPRSYPVDSSPHAMASVHTLMAAGEDWRIPARSPPKQRKASPSPL